MLQVMLEDNVKARVLDAAGTYLKKGQCEPFVDSQAGVYGRRRQVQSRRRLRKSRSRNGSFREVLRIGIWYRRQ
ncbi:MAG: hypothetical protein ACLUUO_14005 [Sellimonas intestinalis]